MWADLLIFLKEHCHPPRNKTLPSMWAARGENLGTWQSTCACTLGVINEKCKCRWDFGSIKYLMSKQKLPLWPREGFDSTINATCAARSWERWSSSPSWGKQPDLACLGQEDQTTCQSPSSSSSQHLHTQKTVLVTFHWQSSSCAHI